MWALLRGRRFSGFKFRRQQPLGPYIVDFLCKDRSLIIELDGGQHQEHADADDIRTTFFESHGFRVLRFWNHEFLKEPLTVFECILKEIQNRLPHPGPLPRGEGKKPGLFSGGGLA
jgi:very-short-patch-repair endonuclease